MPQMTVMQLLPDLKVGGVERGTLEVAAALVQHGHRALVVSQHGPMVEELVSYGAEHIALPIGKKSLATLRYIRQLRKIIHKENVDIVHARSRLPAWIGARAINGIAPAKRPCWITTVHGPYSVNRYSRIMLSGQKIIAISEFIRQYIINNYPTVNPECIEVIHRGVDTERYHPHFRPSESWFETFRSQCFYDENKSVLLFPGRLTRWKGQAAFITLMHQLREAGKNVVGLIVGAQSDKNSGFENELREQVKQANLQDDVFFLGNRDDMRELLALADISYSLPNIPEAFGRTTLEALSLGTPVIGYDEGGTGEILSHIFPQGLISKDDEQTLFEKTLEFLEDPPSVGANTQMTTANLQGATLAVYRSLLD